MTDDIVARLRAVLHNDRSVELMKREAADEIERLHRDYSCICNEMRRMMDERDEAREEVCRMVSDADQSSNPESAKEVAERRGWDCFKEANDDR